MNVLLSKIKPDSTQPRRTFEDIEGLAQAIKNEGMLQPILVDSHYVIIEGERRYRAAKLLSLKEVPVVIADVKDDKKRLVWQIMQDIHHKDIPILERDRAWYRLWKQLKMPTYTKMGEILGVSRYVVDDAINRAQFVPKRDHDSMPAARSITSSSGLPEGIREKALLKMKKEGMTTDEEVGTFISRLKEATPEKQQEILSTPRTDYSRVADRIVSACKVITDNLNAELFTKIPQIEVVFLTSALTELKKKLKTYNAQEGEIVE